jgi:hypothetical protein
VDSVLSIDVTLQMYFTVGGVPGRERPRKKGFGRPFPLVGRVAAFARGQGASLGGDGEGGGGLFALALLDLFA